MMKRVVFVEDHTAASKNYSDSLLLRGFDVLCVAPDQLKNFAPLVGQFEVYVCAVADGPSWTQCQKWFDLQSHTPVLYMLAPEAPQRKSLKTDDMHQVVRPTCGRQKFLYKIDLLGRMARMHRRIQELSQLASGSTAVDQMFTTLDAHHILDRMLSYFGARMDVTNISWVRWTALHHLLQTQQQVLALEMDISNMRSPRVMNLFEGDMLPLIETLHQTVHLHDLPERAKQSFWVQSRGRDQLLYVVVHSLNGGEPLGVLLFEGLESGQIESLAPQITETLRLMARYVEFGLSHWDSKSLAMVDDLTALYNQRFLPTVLDNEIARAKRRGSAFSVLFMDLDFFKQVNDTKGHWIGSKLLQEIGEILKGSIRSCDYGFRYGGDEFVVILPDTDIHGGQIVAERIRKVIETTQFLIDGHELRLTVSVGLAGYPHHALTREEIIQLADQAMYYGKRKSRNIVYVAS